jgi:hypothetical protein
VGVWEGSPQLCIWRGTSLGVRFRDPIRSSRMTYVPMFDSGIAVAFFILCHFHMRPSSTFCSGLLVFDGNGTGKKT